ncbi:MAG: DMT family transporter [Selenomonadaceae bacterium]|nr:DMT family transporter [Selenomonadaceae bacterium]MDY2685612.1 DMT family transporter [Selenomonadaceae bacterium]
MHTSMRGNVALLIAAVIWGGGFVAQSAGMDYIGPFTFSAARDAIGFFVLIPVLLLLTDGRGKALPARLSVTRITLVGGIVNGLVLGVADTFQQVGLMMTTAGKAGFITALYMVFTPLLGYFVGHRLTKRIAFCVLLAILGFYFLCIAEQFTLTFGDLLELGCAVFFAVHILTIDHYLLRQADSVKMAWVQFAAAFFFSGTLTMLFEQPDTATIWEARIPILYCGVLSSGVAYTLQIVGQKYTDPTIGTLIMSLESVFAVLFGWLVLGELMTGRETLGCVLVFAAVLLAQLPLSFLTNCIKKARP